MKGNYTRFPGVEKANENRYRLMTADLSAWTAAMIVAVGHYEKTWFFRWHDSGDVQSVEHLNCIAAIATALPQIRFWLPTREYGYVVMWQRLYGAFPSNLVVRLSAHMVDGAAAPSYTGYVSAVSADDSLRTCPAPDNDGKCGKCRKCWFDDSVTYGKH